MHHGEGDDGGSEIFGRRVSDGSLISFREAVRMFATKDELVAQQTALERMGDRLDEMPTLEEYKLRWQMDDEYRREVKATLEMLKSARLPSGFINTIGTLIAICIAVYGAVHK
jgi:hypothetical protein